MGGGLLSRVKPRPGTKGPFVPGGGFTRDKRPPSYICVRLVPLLPTLGFLISAASPPQRPPSPLLLRHRVRHRRPPGTVVARPRAVTRAALSLILALAPRRRSHRRRPSPHGELPSPLRSRRAVAPISLSSFHRRSSAGARCHNSPEHRRRSTPLPPPPEPHRGRPPFRPSQPQPKEPSNPAIAAPPRRSTSAAGLARVWL